MSSIRIWSRSASLTWTLVLAACGGPATGPTTPTPEAGSSSAGSSSAGSSSADTETPIAALDVPEPVRATLARVLGEQASVRVERDEREDGTVEYEVEAQAPMEVELRDDGTLLRLELGVAVGLLPPRVAEAVARCWAGAEIDEVEVVVRGDTLLWAVEASRAPRESVAGADPEPQELEGDFYPDGRVDEGDPCDGDEDGAE